MKILSAIVVFFSQFFHNSSKKSIMGMIAKHQVQYHNKLLHDNALRDKYDAYKNNT